MSWRNARPDLCPDCRRNRRFNGGACPPCLRRRVRKEDEAKATARGFLVKMVHKSIFDKAVAHVWTGEDTACRMWSTGGIPHRERFEVVDATDLPICAMCRTVASR